MTRRRFVLVTLVSLLAACAPAGTSGKGAADEPDYRALVESLRSAGLAVQPAGEIDQPFFRAKARVIRIGDSGEAQVYEYPSESEAAADAARVDARGAIGGSMPLWIAPPHFFRRGRLMVLYLGSDEKTLDALRGRLGSEFAGDASPARTTT